MCDKRFADKNIHIIIIALTPHEHQIHWIPPLHLHYTLQGNDRFLELVQQTKCLILRYTAVPAPLDEVEGIVLQVQLCLVNHSDSIEVCRWTIVQPSEWGRKKLFVLCCALLVSVPLVQISLRVSGINIVGARGRYCDVHFFKVLNNFVCEVLVTYIDTNFNDWSIGQNFRFSFPWQWWHVPCPKTWLVGVAYTHIVTWEDP